MTARACSIDGCEKGGKLKRGWCPMHYWRWQKHGDPLALLPQPSRSEFFAARTERRDGCLIWTGKRTSGGYGQMRGEYAHRYAWERANGPIPSGKVIDHALHCDRACVEITHLRLATNQQNGQNVGTALAVSKTGVRGVHPTASGRYTARVKHGGRIQHLGTFDTIAEAEAVAVAKRAELFGDFAGRSRRVIRTAPVAVTS